jgi:hypothetical protein
MQIQITIAVLALLTAAILLVRIFWTRFPPRLGRFLVRGSIVMIAIQTVFEATKWGTSAAHLNVLIAWLAVAGYELLVMLFSRFSPKWLTVLCACILIVPLFASSILFPLALLFQRGLAPRVPIGNHLFYRLVTWQSGGASDVGADLDIFYSPPFAPFLTHKIQTQGFSSRDCNAAAAYAELGPTPGTAIARCPHWPGQDAGTENKLLRLR